MTVRSEGQSILAGTLAAKAGHSFSWLLSRLYLSRRKEPLSWRLSLMGGVGLIALLAACGSDPPVISCNDIGAGACTGARGVAQPSIEPTTHAIVLSAPTARPEDSAAPIALAGGTIRITEVRFDGDSAALSTTEEQRLRALVSQLGDLGSETIRVTGFTERPGLSQDQASLADQRAGAVVWALQMLHVDAQRLDAGLGIVTRHASQRAGDYEHRSSERRIFARLRRRLELQSGLAQLV